MANITIEKSKSIRFKDGNVVYIFETKEDVVLEFRNNKVFFAANNKNKNLYDCFRYLDGVIDDFSDINESYDLVIHDHRYNHELEDHSVCFDFKTKGLFFYFDKNNEVCNLLKRIGDGYNVTKNKFIEHKTKEGDCAFMRSQPINFFVYRKSENRISIVFNDGSTLNINAFPSEANDLMSILKEAMDKK